MSLPHPRPHNLPLFAITAVVPQGQSFKFTDQVLDDDTVAANIRNNVDARQVWDIHAHIQ